MRLGYGLITCQRYPGDPRTWADLYREAVELARLCEQAGLDSVWASEHHFVDDGYMTSLAVTSGALAAATRSIEIGTAVVLAPLHHPLRLAEDAATVACIAGGRFVLGLGAGWRPEEFERLGVARQATGSRMSEIVRILRASWGPEPFTFDGRHFRFEATNVTPKPPGPIPIFLGGSAEGALRRAGRLADGFLGSTTPLEGLPAQKEVVGQGLASAGRDPSAFRYWVHEPVWVSDDPEGDLEEALRRYHFVRWKYTDMAAAESRRSDPLPEPPPLDDASREALRHLMIIGTPQEVAERLRAFEAVLGEGGQVIARSYYPGQPFEEAASMIEMLGRVKALLA